MPLSTMTIHMGLQVKKTMKHKSLFNYKDDKSDFLRDFLGEIWMCEP